MADEPVCHFWKLPPELREMVLEYAYSEEEVLKIKDRARYKVELRKWSRGDRRPATVTTLSPSCPVLR
ncbi:hypothetical protein Tdes44962_MAKER03933 [Teratosphaeria destructans]|uniref:Uncharacterized protein n=1 Tax=Teratosphaeria destructans TaxID=418781 RepID=A0A9W7SNN1_9PEZI|nr:hypothetical protein Tdes44962_MAKER03933 [Teratosphaeria destructans]